MLHHVRFAAGGQLTDAGKCGAEPRAQTDTPLYHLQDDIFEGLCQTPEMDFTFRHGFTIHPQGCLHI